MCGHRCPSTTGMWRDSSSRCSSGCRRGGRRMRRGDWRARKLCQKRIRPSSNPSQSPPPWMASSSTTRYTSLLSATTRVMSQVSCLPYCRTAVQHWDCLGFCGAPPDSFCDWPNSGGELLPPAEPPVSTDAGEAAPAGEPAEGSHHSLNEQGNSSWILRNAGM